MPKRDLERVSEQVRQMAERLIADEKSMSNSQLASQLRQSGIDPEALKRTFYEAAKAISARELAAGRVSPLGLRQAIEQTAPDDAVPSSQKAADSKMERWLDRFGAPYSLPEQLESVRAYRKSGDVSADELSDLDDLEQRLKESIKKDHEGEI